MVILMSSLRGQRPESHEEVQDKLLARRLERKLFNLSVRAELYEKFNNSLWRRIVKLIQFLFKSS
tara:strand:+ start:64 stop:258 length:195 start_codon:yes stop_codon:yes gene_type:complete